MRSTLALLLLTTVLSSASAAKTDVERTAKKVYRAMRDDPAFPRSFLRVARRIRAAGPAAITRAANERGSVVTDATPYLGAQLEVEVMRDDATLHQVTFGAGEDPRSSSVPHLGLSDYRVPLDPHGNVLTRIAAGHGGEEAHMVQVDTTRASGVGMRVSHGPSGARMSLTWFGRTAGQRERVGVSALKLPPSLRLRDGSPLAPDTQLIVAGEHARNRVLSMRYFLRTPGQPRRELSADDGEALYARLR